MKGLIELFQLVPRKQYVFTADVLENITFGILGDDCFVSLRKIIQSQVYQVVLTTTPFKELKMLRAFQLLTEKSNTTLFLAGLKEATNAWPISLQLNITQGSRGFQIDVLKQKYGAIE